MKTMIVFASRSGTAEKCARKLSEALTGEVRIVDIGREESPTIDSYDRVIVGASIKVGQIQKQIKEFVQQNIQKLREKKTGVFLCMGFDESQFKTYLEQNLPEEFLTSCKAKGFFGGEFNMGKLGLVSRMMVKAVSKGKPQPKLIESNISSFAAAMED